MRTPAAAVIDPVHECSDADCDSSAECRPGCHIRQPVRSEIHTTERHDDGERRCQHLEIPSSWTCRHENDHRSDCDCRPGHGVTGRKGPARGFGQRHRWAGPHVEILDGSDHQLRHSHGHHP